MPTSIPAAHHRIAVAFVGYTIAVLIGLGLPAAAVLDLRLPSPAGGWLLSVGVVCAVVATIALLNRPQMSKDAFKALVRAEVTDVHAETHAGPSTSTLRPS